MTVIGPDLDTVLSTGLLAAISGYLNDFGAAVHLPPLAWTLGFEYDAGIGGTHPGGRAHPNSEALCASWADLLGLTESKYGPGEGFRTWTGDLSQWELRVFAVTDPDLYQSTYTDDPETRADATGPRGQLLAFGVRAVVSFGVRAVA